jgi:hypothetical protein
LELKLPLGQSLCSHKELFPGICYKRTNSRLLQNPLDLEGYKKSDGDVYHTYPAAGMPVRAGSLGLLEPALYAPAFRRSMQNCGGIPAHPKPLSPGIK